MGDIERRPLTVDALTGLTDPKYPFGTFLPGDNYR